MLHAQDFFLTAQTVGCEPVFARAPRRAGALKPERAARPGPQADANPAVCGDPRQAANAAAAAPAARLLTQAELQPAPFFAIARDHLAALAQEKARAPEVDSRAAAETARRRRTRVSAGK